MQQIASVFAAGVRWVRNFSVHKRAPAILFGISAIESFFFPIPPDVMLIPMSIAKPKYHLYFALLTTVGSVVGACIGYAIGYYAFATIAQPFLSAIGLGNTIETVMQQYQQYGGALLLLAGITPIPFKVFTVCSGALHMEILPFILYSLIGRSIRFFCVAALSAKYGQKAVQWMYSHQRIGTLLCALCILTLFMWLEG